MRQSQTLAPRPKQARIRGLPDAPKANKGIAQIILPIVIWHGAGQFSKTWETTPNGREGFQTIFLRRRFATDLIGQPRRGNAGRSMVEATLKPTPDEQFWFGQFQVGVWPNYFDGVQFDRKPETLNKYFRAMTLNTGPFDASLISDSVSALFGRIGPGILMTHSQSGGPGWLRDQEPERPQPIAFANVAISHVKR